MQKKTFSKSLLFVALIIFVLISCNDDDKKTCTLTSLSGVIEDGSFTNTFTYNGGILVGQTSTYVGSFNATISINYVYNSNGDLTEMNWDNSKKKYTYNNSGLIIKSEDYYGIYLIEQVEYEYTDGKVTKAQFYESGGGSLQKADYDVFEYASASAEGANKITHYNVNGTVTGTSAYEYGTKKIKIPRGMDALYKTFISEGFGIENHVIKKTYTSGSIVNTKTVTYQYNNDGYLTEEVHTTIQGSNTTTEAFTYNYSCN